MSNTGSKFLLGFLAGILTGAAIGLLLAPESGEETRNLIREKIDQYAEEGKKIIEKAKEKAQKEQ